MAHVDTMQHDAAFLDLLEKLSNQNALFLAAMDKMANARLEPDGLASQLFACMARVNPGGEILSGAMALRTFVRDVVPAAKKILDSPTLCIKFYKSTDSAEKRTLLLNALENDTATDK